MVVLLKYSLLAEPDRQRLSRFVLSAVEDLGGNIFSSAICLDKCMVELYKLVQSAVEPVETKLILDDKNLYVEVGETTYQICMLSEEPTAEEIRDTSTRLSQESELADPELLRQRNAKISEYLEKAVTDAAEEMSQLEQQLDARRIELEEAQKNAETDGLTGLYNRGAYDSRLEKAMARCRRQGEPLCLMMLDVDNFKEINDTHGHLYGDEYLKKVANSMVSASRKEVDHCCRVGGDEFALILYTKLSTTERVAKAILKKMDNNISIGIAQMLPDDTPKDLASRCDGVLYEAKENGRGQFIASHITTVDLKKSDKRAN